MLVVQIVRHRGVHLVPLGPLAGLVATDQQDGASARVEREQDSQCAVLAGSQAVEQDPRPRVIATVYLIAKDQAFLLDQGEMHFVELQRIRTHRNQGKDGRYRWYNDYRLPDGDQITVRLHGNADDDRRKLNRPENVRPISPNDPDFYKLFRQRNDAESINRGLDDTLFLRRAHSLGHRRQWINLLGFALMVNSLALEKLRKPQRLAA